MTKRLSCLYGKNLKNVFLWDRWTDFKEKVKVGKDKEKAQSEKKDSQSKKRGGKKTN